ncbi:MAG: hypothetical protein FJ139_10685 [Deltaproteobacteria bacterium]|nr:hypothetical protein [Deltaproteobacteria bacterium]
MKSLLLRITLSSLLIVLFVPNLSQSATERRTALVIGNGAYASGRLKNPTNDATDMASALKRLGFQVILKTNVRHQEMEEAMEEFGNRLKRGGVGLFYFAGHGVQVGGTNYLIPIGAKIRKESDVKFQALDVNKVLDEMANANNGLNILILDACRDNPFGRSFRSASRGLAIISSAPEGTFISYATGPGQVAQDGTGKNSPYTGALLKNIATPGLPIEALFKKVRVQLSRNKQTPWELSSLRGEFYFVPGTKVAREAEELLTESPTQKVRERDDVAMAKPPSPPEIERTYTSPTLGAKFIFIPAGAFGMGRPGVFVLGKYYDRTEHQVTISRPFYMQTTEVTQGQWQKVMGKNPSGFKDCGDECPVEQVSWNDVQDFIRKLNSMEGTDKYRLPTEAEWEYAARSGGSQEAFAGTSSESGLKYYAWYIENSEDMTHPVEQKRPNGFGLYDMTGNVWEWCQDWEGDYPSGSVTDPTGPSSGSARIRRGGSYDYHPNLMYTTSRSSSPPDRKYKLLGFRLVRTP